MAIRKVDFDTPQSGTDYDLQVTGTVAAYSIAHVKVTLSVTGSHPSRSDAFYRVINFDNSTGTNPSFFHGTYSIAVVPKLATNSTILAAHIEKSY